MGTVMMWQTPIVQAAGEDLAATAQGWPTPAARDVKGANRNETHATDQLANVVNHWLTPDVPNGGRGLRTGQTPTGTMPDGSKRQVGLENQTRSLSGPPLPATATAGDPPSSAMRRLNPRFVEWLMGWPLGWTDFAPVATEWSRWRRRMRSELSRLS